ncbi:hypothetical protein LDL08_01730 [Nonomuraea glycinis]|uniref:Uncharacterized protein n=1 Tax=Nonomuraea glycinis TaxID=2047744 RepID=A0A918E3I5_9ACTN|nr:hypothetical protein [Nonomuraea glycinis]MCA2174897.1 hypothetical protein [Nonomuraea glycinis]GGP01434.1 hypothetical protein GCM10012278_04670 [Nonomuraea glycinis]
MPFDPEATGIIPRLDLESVKETPPSGSADPKASPPPDPPEPEDDSAGDDEDVSATMTFRIPTSAAVRIGGPPTLDEPTLTDEQAKDPGSAEEQGKEPGKEPGPAGKPAKKSASAGKRGQETASAEEQGKETRPALPRLSGGGKPARKPAPKPTAPGGAAEEVTATQPTPVAATGESTREAPVSDTHATDAPPKPSSTPSPKAGGRPHAPPASPDARPAPSDARPAPPDARPAPSDARPAPPDARSGSPEARSAPLSTEKALTPDTTPPSIETALKADTAPPSTEKALKPGAAPATPGTMPTGPAGPTVKPAESDGEAAGAGAADGERGQVRERAGQASATGIRGRISALIASAPQWLPLVLVLEGLVMYVLALKVSPGPLRGVNPADINGLGLIAALPASAFAAILIMLVSFFVTVAQSTDRKFLLLFQIAAITFALHGAGALVAEEPRFPTAYIHAGFVEFIGRTGESAINIDARMGWPGFFALFAFVTKAAGITDLTPILNWTPLLSNLLYLLPFVLILRQVVATTRARWFAALLFVLVQWIGQDYFSSQGFTFALYLAFLAILLRWFGRVEPRKKPLAPKGLRRLLGRLDAMTPGELANTGMYRADKLLMLMLMIALFVAATASHQITPFMMLGVMTAFLILKRTSLTWALPFSLGMVVLTWISYQAVGFWAGQIEAIFGGLGRILTNLQTNTGDRIEGTDPLHALVLQARLGILMVILALAAVGLFRRMRRGVFDRAALILLCVPVTALGLQSYGGEIGLRIYMFALPGACLLAAFAFFPNLPADSADVREETVPLRKRNARFNPELTKKVSLVLAACFAVAFSMAFLVARYGNEQFERVTAGEVAAMHYVYEHDKPSARVVYMTSQLGPEVTPTLPWGERDIELVNFAGQVLVHKDPTNVADVVKRMAPGPDSPRNTYLVVNRGQINFLQLNENFPDGWGEKFRATLDATPQLKKVYANKDAALYTWKSFVRGTETPDPQPYQTAGDPSSPWTPVGVAALIVMWAALFGYEVIRLNGVKRAPRARKWLLFIGIPAFAVALGVIIERFIYIALGP